MQTTRTVDSLVLVLPSESATAVLLELGYDIGRPVEEAHRGLTGLGMIANIFDGRIPSVSHSVERISTLPLAAFWSNR